MKKLAYFSGAILGFLAVALGAFGAHALEEQLISNGRMDTFQTGSRYQMYHALLLIGLAIIAERGESRWLKAAIVSAFVGVIVFSGSLYLLSILDIPKFGMITPLGGLGLMIAWLSLFMHAYQQKTSQPI